MEYNRNLSPPTGPLPYPLTNDYLFRALLQENTYVLKGLICSLLHLKPSEIISVEITNPIILGKAISDKEFILDIHIILNNNAHVNLEMQVINDGNWRERSLGYLCRTFDNLNRGDDYIDTKAAIHIGFLDFHLFPESPEFYATYMLTNVKNYTIYSDKFILSVVDLNHIELATPEDKEYQLDYWASLFKATTWEDIKMLAKDNKYIEEAYETIYKLTMDDTIRSQIEARNAYYARERHHAKIQKAYDEAIDLLKQMEKVKSTNVALTTEIELLRKEIALLKSKAPSNSQKERMSLSMISKS